MVIFPPSSPITFLINSEPSLRTSSTMDHHKEEHAMEMDIEETEEKLRRYLEGRGSSRRMSFDPRDIHIMVVDDEKTSRIVVQKILKKCGYQDVTNVGSAKEALKLLNEDKSRYSVVISDIKMPEMDGIELLQEIMADPELRQIPVIMMSAIEELQLVYQCLSKGATDYIVKPVRQQQVQNLWQNVWRKRQEQKLVGMYELEKGQKKEMQETVSMLRQEIDTLKDEMTAAIQAPIMIISDTVGKLINNSGVSNEVRDALVNVLKALKASHNLYKPALDNYLSRKDVDPQTRTWLTSELSVTDDKDTDVFDSSFWVKPIDSQTTEQLRSWEFDVWSFDNEESLMNLVVEIFRDFNLFDLHRIDITAFRHFLVELKKNYHCSNPYHNFRHAFDCIHMCYLLVTRAKASEYLNSIEILALFFAALLHDVDHPGLNNTFQIQTLSELALRYNDRSVLENHHCSSGFQLLLKFDLLKGLTPDEFRRFRKVVVDIILATDLTYHVEFVSKMQNVLKGDRFKREDDDHRGILVVALMKCADVSNPTRTFPVAKYWARMVQEEFFMQGDKEKERCMKVSAFMDRGNSSLPQMQLNFIDFLVAPLFSSITDLLPEVKVPLGILAKNRTQWAELLEAEKASIMSEPELIGGRDATDSPKTV